MQQREMGRRRRLKEEKVYQKNTTCPFTGTSDSRSPECETTEGKEEEEAGWSAEVQRDSRTSVPCSAPSRAPTMLHMVGASPPEHAARARHSRGLLAREGRKER